MSMGKMRTKLLKVHYAHTKKTIAKFMDHGHKMAPMDSKERIDKEVLTLIDRKLSPKELVLLKCALLSYRDCKHCQEDIQEHIL
jgi:hypothetical protein